MEWRKYSLPHVIYDQYCKNTKKNYKGNRFGGDSYFLAHLSDHVDITEAGIVAAFIIATPVLLIDLLLFIPAFGLAILTLAAILSALDTYSTRKWRVRLNFINSLKWIYNKDPKKVRNL